MAHYEINFSNWQASWISMEDYRPEDGFEEIVGDSKALNRMLKLAMKVARSDAPVLILGEDGSGKELIARAIHRISARKNQSFVKVNCTAEASAAGELERYVFGLENEGQDERKKFGYIELANEGTLFLDEIALSRQAFRRSCFVCCRARKLSGRTAFPALGRTCASSRPPNTTSENAWRKKCFGAICRPIEPIPCPGSGLTSDATTFPCWFAISCRSSPGG